MTRDVLLLVFGLALGIAAGLFAGRSRGEPAAEPAAVGRADEVGEVASKIARPASPGSTTTERLTEEELEVCRQALNNAWKNVSHPIEVSDKESSLAAARRFSEVYYGDDDPAKVEEYFEGGGPAREVREALADGPLEGSEIRVSCDPLPCVVEMDLAYADAEGVPREELDAAFRGMGEELGGAMMGSLEGYDLLEPSLRGGSDPAQRTLWGMVSTHSDEDLEELLESMVLFLEEATGSKRFEDAPDPT
jgi:hypothetical protein